MDLSKLEFFFAAANSSSFTQAAEKCNIAQTTMSKYIAQLESELGVRLFYRTTRECSLTEAGHLFYNGAKELYRDYENLRRQVRRVSGNELSIGVYGEFFDLSILRRFNDAHPEISMNVSFGDKDTMYDQLVRGKIHAIMVPDILVSSSVNNPALRKVDILSGEACLYCSRAALEQYGTIARVISELPYVTKAVETSYHEYCRQILLEHFGTTFRDVTTVESKARQDLLVELSQGFAIMLRPEAQGDRDLISYSLDGIFNETLQLYYTVRHVPESLKVFIDYIHSVTFFS